MPESLTLTPNAKTVARLGRAVGFYNNVVMEGQTSLTVKQWVIQVLKRELIRINTQEIERQGSDVAMAEQQQAELEVNIS